MDIRSNQIVILDFGSQYTRLIARRIRELNVFSEILPPNTSVEEILDHKPKGLILSGGPEIRDVKYLVVTSLCLSFSRFIANF